MPLIRLKGGADYKLLESLRVCYGSCGRISKTLCARHKAVEDSPESLGECLGRAGMPKGPQGRRRPAGVIGCAVSAGKAATEEIGKALKKAHGRTRSGQAGASVRAEKTKAEQRGAPAKRWA